MVRLFTQERDIGRKNFMQKPIKLIFSCEHAVATVPELYKSAFAAYAALLNSHQGIDFGAAYIAEKLSTAFNAPLFMATTTRLLIDCNRSLGRGFSEISRQFSKQEQQNIITNFYQPYRDAVRNCIASFIQQGVHVWHISVHSFTPVLRDIRRNAEIGILYDPQRCAEKIMAAEWQKQLRLQCKKEQLGWRIRMNYPYKGTDDGFTTSLRKIYPDTDYLGIEVESNQALMLNNSLKEKVEIILQKTLEAILRS